MAADARETDTAAGTWWRDWLVGPPDRWLTLSLFVAMALLSSPSPRQAAVTFHLLLLGAVLLLSLRWRVAPLAIGAVLLAGIDLRLAYIGTGSSDVLTVTRAAIDLALAGGNPYGIGYELSTPPGAPFAYGPLALLWYLPAAEPRVMELAASFVVLGLLAVRGRPLGLAIYAAAPALLSLASDGSNDTTAGLLVLGALVLVPRMPNAGAFALGLAAAFKPHALAFAPPLVAWAGPAVLVPLVAGAGIFWLPAFLMWGAPAVLESLRLADRVHRAPYYSLGHALAYLGVSVPAEVLNIGRLVIGAVTAVVVMATVRTYRGVVIGGVAIFLATLFSGFWATFAYFAAIAPIICWHLDGWLGMAARRVTWPGDPVGRLTAYADRRWPVRSRGSRPARA